MALVKLISSKKEFNPESGELRNFIHVLLIVFIIFCYCWAVWRWFFWYFSSFFYSFSNNLAFCRGKICLYSFFPKLQSFFNISKTFSVFYKFVEFSHKSLMIRRLKNMLYYLAAKFFRIKKFSMCTDIFFLRSYIQQSNKQICNVGSLLRQQLKRSTRIPARDRQWLLWND